MKPLAPKIEYLDIRDNPSITKIPGWLHEVPKVDYDANNVTFPPAAISTGGWFRVQKYLKRYVVGNDPNRQIKLMLVGDGGVGKTTCKYKTILSH